ncbi:hypothetical protein BOX15_Mlig006308g1 [Macrostomum lignano]|uniref:DSL domain-containing protein n=1 Tax=Macrostomum lignano TaxID=282301 RepID=A0A267FJF3_9PLAT|nr:hypothetical protein BOX15_Mlig006308g1 [Macrostomum lignano]
MVTTNLLRLAFLLSTPLISIVEANGTFFVKFDEFENHLGLKADHANCDSGRPCDPKFIIEVRGGWGLDEKKSDCFNNKNHILFENTIGTALPNPLRYRMHSPYIFPITIGIKVKECLFDLDRDEIADFFQQLDDLPRPFLHGEPFDPDSDRIRKLELGSLAPAPISIKMRLSVWHRCDLNFYGQKCDKLCRSVQSGWSCNSDGILVCSLPETCNPEAATSATTVQATTKTTVTSSTAAIGTSPSVSTESKSASSLLQSTTSTRTSQSVSMNSGEVNQASDVQPSIVQILSSRLDLVLVVILMLVVIGIITAVTSVLLCSRRRRRRRPILVSGVSYNRDGIGLDLPLGTSGVEGQYPQLPNCTNPAYITSTERQQMQYGQEQSDRPGRPDSGVYEEPIDFSERNLPPLPARGVGAATFSRKI